MEYRIFNHGIKTLSFVFYSLARNTSPMLENKVSRNWLNAKPGTELNIKILYNYSFVYKMRQFVIKKSRSVIHAVLRDCSIIIVKTRF